MTYRKSVRELTREEKDEFVEAVWSLKESGEYAKYVRWHVEAVMNPTLAPGETVPPGAPEADFRNSAHRGPAFLPWHREFLRRFERNLRSAAPGVTLPYWDWTEDAGSSDPSSDVFEWSRDLEDLVGGDGDPNDDDYVKTGPFAYRPDDPEERSWTILDPGLLEIVPYDPPKRREVDPLQWNASSYPSFRNVLEGFVDVYGDRTPAFHNFVHVWVGGSIAAHTSPNDPVFFLHHCFVDELWAEWQREHPRKGYVPTSDEDAPPGHGLDDPMHPWDDATPAAVLDHRDLGYRYTGRRVI